MCTIELLGLAHMNPVDTFEIGIAPEHIPSLLAVIALPAIVLLVGHLRPTIPPGLGQRLGDRPYSSMTLFDRWVAWLLAICSAVHLALPLGQHDRPVLTLGFLATGGAYAWLAMRVVEGRPWRLWTALLLVASLLTYALVSVSGAEQPDQVGIATVLIELTVLGLCLVPLREPGRRRRFARFAGSTGTVFTAFGVGALVWAGALAAHNGTNTDVAAAGASATTTALDHDHHSHTQDSRAQAGIVVGPVPSGDPTDAQQQAAAQLSVAVKADTARFANLDAALAAGYQLPAAKEGMAVHLENKAYEKDGRILDPQRPETLVYAISGGRATLLGALFVMEKGGQPGPAIGGPITHWHAHNVCVTVLPPGFGLVTPFGGCTALSVDITTPEMMHVWVVDSPAGPFADGLDDAWVRAYHAQHAVPYSAG
jgi:hypothetical protein